MLVLSSCFGTNGNSLSGLFHPRLATTNAAQTRLRLQHPHYRLGPVAVGAARAPVHRLHLRQTHLLRPVLPIHLGLCQPGRAVLRLWLHGAPPLPVPRQEAVQHQRVVGALPLALVALQLRQSPAKPTPHKTRTSHRTVCCYPGRVAQTRVFSPPTQPQPRDAPQKQQQPPGAPSTFYLAQRNSRQAHYMAQSASHHALSRVFHHCLYH